MRFRHVHLTEQNNGTKALGLHPYIQNLKIILWKSDVKGILPQTKTLDQSKMYTSTFVKYFLYFMILVHIASSVVVTKQESMAHEALANAKENFSQFSLAS